MRRRQTGITFIGLICILALVGVIAYAGIILTPLYLNYMKVAKSMERVATEFKGERPDPGAIRRSLEHHWIVEDISEVDSKDIEVKKEGDAVTMHVGYDHSVPYLGNISLTVTFDKTVNVQ